MLGTPAEHGGRRADSGAQHRRRSAQAQSVTDGGNAVRDRKDVATRQRQRTRHSSDFPGSLSAVREQRKPRTDPFAKTEQGWPAWLMAVAGEAIGDWAPRRANTFEKLAKVIIRKH